MKSVSAKLAAYSTHFFLLVLVSLTCLTPVLAQPAATPKKSPSPAAPSGGPAVTRTMVDETVSGDATVEKMVAVYSPKVRELDVVLGRLKGELRKGGTGAGSLGNFVTDGMRWQATLKAGKTITVALMNSGGMRRSTIGEGELRARDIFELLPFENALVTVDLTGAQLKALLESVLTSNEAQSGARIVYKATPEKKNQATSIKLREVTGENEIDPARTYTVVTIDYLYNVGGTRFAALREGTNMKPLGITLRESIMNYVKSEAAAGKDIRPNLDGRFSFDRAASPPTTPPE